MAKVNCFDAKCTTFIWKVEYPYLCKNCNLCSPSFSMDSCGVTRYCLNFVSQNTHAGCYNILLYLKKHEWDCDPGPVVLNLNVSINGYKVDENFSLQHFKFIGNAGTIFEGAVSIMDVTDCLAETNITFHVEIEPDLNFLEIEDLWTCNYEDLELLSSDITGMLRDRQFTDLTFRCIIGKPIPLHTAIFAFRYPALAKFLDLLKNPKQEYNLGIDFDGISVLMHYLYSGNINVANSTFGLLELLNKAQLHHLQHILYSEPRIVHVSTSVPSKYGSFVWIIPKFSKIKNNKYIINCLHCDSLLAWTQLRILFYIRENGDGERCIAFKVQRMQQERELLVRCKISLLNEDEYCKSFILNFDSQRELVISSFIEIKTIERREHCFLTDDTLKIRFEVVLSNLEEASQYDCVRCLHVEGDFPSIVKNLWSLRKDISRLYLNSAFSDITIRCGELLIPAHKVILCARSPFFSRILQNENEIEDNTITINNFDEETVVNTLSYMYCGEVNSESKCFEWTVNLYKAASEFELSRLKEKCTQFFKTVLDSSNAAIALELSDEYFDSSLQKCAKDFIFSNLSEVLESGEWIRLMNEKYDLATKVINTFLD